MQVIFMIATTMAIAIALIVTLTGDSQETTVNGPPVVNVFPKRVSRFLVETKNPRAADHCNKDNEICYYLEVVKGYNRKLAALSDVVDYFVAIIDVSHRCKDHGNAVEDRQYEVDFAIGITDVFCFKSGRSCAGAKAIQSDELSSTKNQQAKGIREIELVHGMDISSLVKQLPSSRKNHRSVNMDGVRVQDVLKEYNGPCYEIEKRLMVVRSFYF
ncbi:hypothetical protein Tco_0985693 [Tanacetum coccineum]